MTARGIDGRADRPPGSEAGGIRRAQPECDLYIPGHMVHWIQAKLSWERPREWGVLEEVQGQVITVRFSDRIFRYRSHQVEAVLDVAEPGSSVSVSARYGILGVPSGPVSYEDLVDRLEDRGGFSVPAALLPLSDGIPKGVDDGA